MNGNIGGLVKTEEAYCDSPKQIESPSLLETLQRKKLQLENKSKEVDDAIAFLSANPKFEEFSKLLNRVKF